jgi:hypothetical protein
MGMDVGEIVKVEPQPPEDVYFNIYVEFHIQSPYYGYLWTEGSRTKVATGDFLGKRYLEVTKGTNGYPIYLFYETRSVTVPEAMSLDGLTNQVFLEEIDEKQTNVIARPLQGITPEILKKMSGLSGSFLIGDKANVKKLMTAVWDDKKGGYVPYTSSSSPYWLQAEEAPALSDRMEEVANQIERALPIVLNLTNQLASALSNTTVLTSNANSLVAHAQPIVTNFAVITANLREPKGSLGEWLIPTNLNSQLSVTLSSANTTLSKATGAVTSLETNITMLATNLDATLQNLANITSNLNVQVQVNTNILGNISSLVTHSDEMIQGLKHHWLLRSAFKGKTNTPPDQNSPAAPFRRPPPRAGKQG